MQAGRQTYLDINNRMFVGSERTFSFVDETVHVGVEFGEHSLLVS
jgi:hypothetical protein